MGTYDTRHTNYVSAHNITEEMYEYYVGRVPLRPDDIAIDFMGGKGETAKRLKAQYPDSRVLVLDLYESQLPDSIETIVSDAREVQVSSDSVDAIYLKVGIHEIPKFDQQGVFHELYRILKPSGKLSMWEIANKGDELAELFRNLIRKKDMLSGFTDLAQNRYFNSEAELLSKISTAGFTIDSNEHKYPFKYRPDNWLTSDFAGDTKKVDLLRAYTLKLTGEKNLDFDWPFIVASK